MIDISEQKPDLKTEILAILNKNEAKRKEYFKNPYSIIWDDNQLYNWFIEEHNAIIQLLKKY